MTRESSRMFVAIETFVTEVNGDIEFVTKDKTRVREDSPIYAGNEEHFREIDDYPDTEQATAAPGEKRGRRPATAAA